jgi:hypothetical protein
MEQRYVSPVTYAFRSFVVPSDLIPAQRPKLDESVLADALAAYHSRTDGPRYKIMASKLGLHLVPDGSAGSDGSLAAARNPLDIPVNLPVALRTLSAHLRALCAELSAASGANIMFMGPAAYPLEQIYMPGGHFGRRGSREDLTVPWGVDRVPAREALVNLLASSATTLRWHLICRTDKNCFIEVLSRGDCRSIFDKMYNRRNERKLHASPL